MAHNLPVISGYADGSADDLVVHGVTGFRTQEGTADELANYLAQLLDDPLRSAEFGAQGQSRIRGELSFERFIDRVVRVLTEQVDLAGR
jgi:glycosyltransferase involved in cell wall biosynthesis